MMGDYGGHAGADAKRQRLFNAEIAGEARPAQRVRTSIHGQESEIGRCSR